ELEATLRESDAQQAAGLISRMEPDEAVDALRDLDDETRQELLAEMDPKQAEELDAMLRYPERTAGGIMTTELVRCRPQDTVTDVRQLLQAATDHAGDIDHVSVVDTEGRLL